MNIEHFFRDEIDFENLKSVAALWGAKASNISEIVFHPGRFGPTYILRFVVDRIPDTFVYFLTKCLAGFKDYKEEQRQLNKAQHPNYSLENPFLGNWAFFVHFTLHDEYELCSDVKYSKKFRYGASDDRMLFDTDGETPVKVLHSYEMDSPNGYAFLNHAINSEDFKLKKSHISPEDDHWVLTETGFKKFVMPGKPVILYQRDGDASKQTSKKPSIDEIESLITPVCPEIKKFYNGLVEEINIVGNYDNIDTPAQTDLYDIALKYFDRTQAEYTHLKKNMLDDKNIFSQVQRRKRTIIGSILHNHLESLDILSPGKNRLHSLHNKIIS